MDRGASRVTVHGVADLDMTEQYLSRSPVCGNMICKDDFVFQGV